MRAGLLAAALLLPGMAWAEGHALVIRNGAGDTVRGVQIGAAGRLGENRLRSQLPPGASGTFSYSAGCTADVRLTFDGGRTEDYAGVDLCGGGSLVAGSGAAGPTVAGVPAAAPAAASSTPAGAGRAATKTTAAAPAAAPMPVKVDVPAWTGKSITKRFGGLE